MNNEILDTEKSPIDYYPSKKMLSSMFNVGVSKKSIVTGFISRTDGMDVDKTIDNLEKIVKSNPSQSGLLSRTLSVSDLSNSLYDRFSNNPNSIYNWFIELKDGLDRTNTFFKTPKTSILRLPIELAQFIRIEYQDTSLSDRKLFNEYIFKAFKLEDDKTYFIKTGTFSSKFQFANAKCSEPREMGEYFQVINNFAMSVGAGQTIDICVREYIDDVEENPTIYNGMPLRTEFRTFVDFDTNTVYGTVPYWDPIVMKRALKLGLSDSMERDYAVYMNHEDKLMSEFNDNVSKVNHGIKDIIGNINLKGRYSIDVMKNGEDFYIIDMALMDESALVDILPEHPFK